MSNKFFISDTHFGHEKCWSTFKRSDGSPLRPFSSTEEMDETMIENWNRVVGPNDTVYHLGDVVINKKFLPQISRLNGKKKLIFGNHDIFKPQEYKDAGFYDFHAYRVFVDDFICSHIPIHPDCVTERYVCNVHGHLHANRVMKWHDFWRSDVDPRYFNVSVEQINYTPISFEDLRAKIKEQQK